MGETFDEELVLGTIRELSEGIGPRLGGSEASHRAADYLSELLGGMGLDVRMQAFSYLGWEYDRMPQISVTAPEDEEIDSQPMAFTVASGGPIEGTLWRDGVVPAIPGSSSSRALRSARMASGGRRFSSRRKTGRLSASEPRPDVHRTGAHIPKADGDRIMAWLDDGKEVRVRLERSADTSRGSPTRT